MSWTLPRPRRLPCVVVLAHSAYDDKPVDADGLTVTEAIIVSTIIVFTSFVLAMFSIDVDRSFT